MRRFFLFIHLVGGLLAALFLIALGGSGALLVFENEIDHALNPKLSRVERQGAVKPLDELVASLQQAHSKARVSNVSLPGDPAISYTISLRGTAPDAKGGTFAIDPYTGAELGDTSAKNPFPRQLHQFHTNLLLGPKGKTITAWSAFFLLGLAVTGIVLWWPRKLWRFTGTPGRRNFELHNVLGIYASVFMLVFAVTGLVIHWDDEAKQLVQRWSGEPAQTTPPSRVTGVSAGAKLLTPGQLKELAEQRLAGARVATLQNLGNATAPAKVTLKYPEDRTPAGRSILLLHPVTGEVLWEQSSRTAPLSIRLVKLWNRQIHTGDVAGWPSRIITSLASFSLPVLAVTGPLIWAMKLARKRKGRLPQI